MESFDKLKALVNGLEAEVTKVEKGNASAGTRVRKGMQEVKALAQQIRTEVIELRGE